MYLCSASSELSLLSFGLNLKFVRLHLKRFPIKEKDRLSLGDRLSQHFYLYIEVENLFKFIKLIPF